jgi:hypothetical protein
MTPKLAPSGDLDAAIEWLHEYVSADFKAQRARFLEPDAQQYSLLARHLQDFFSSDVPSGLSIGRPELDEETLAVFKAQAANARTRPIFKVLQFKHTRHGILYQAYVASPTASIRTGYFESLLVTKIEGDFKIVGRYLACSACFATGNQAGKRCPDCSAKGWDFRQGLRLKVFGKLLDFRRLQAPTNPNYLTEFDSDYVLDKQGKGGADGE